MAHFELSTVYTENEIITGESHKKILKNSEAISDVGIEEQDKSKSTNLTIATRFLLVFQALMIILYFIFVETVITMENFTDIYQMYIGILIMVAFGFGYLYTFMKRYGMGAVGFSFLITIIALEWGVITEVRII